MVNLLAHPLRHGRKITDPPNPSQVDDESALVKKNVVAAKPMRASVSMTKKIVRQMRQSSRATSKAEKFAVSAAGMISRRLSRRNATLDAAPASRGAMGSAARNKRTTQARKANARK